MKYFVESDEELALLLGHELSHYLQGTPKTMMLESAACKALVTVAMAMIDPSGGIGGFAIGNVAAMDRQSDHGGKTVGSVSLKQIWLV